MMRNFVAVLISWRKAIERREASIMMKGRCALKAWKETIMDNQSHHSHQRGL
jgi:hypothetical protein